MREATTFSRILEMKMRFEIGRKLLRSSVDRDGFLRRGWTRACLNDDGKIPSYHFVICWAYAIEHSYIVLHWMTVIINSSVVVQGMTVKLRPIISYFRACGLRPCQVESPLQDKGLDSLLSSHGSHF